MADTVRGRAHCAEMDGDALAALLGRWSSPGACVLVRRVDGAEMLPFDPSAAQRLLQSWTEGQLVSINAEVRWRRLGDRHAVLLLTESEASPGPDFHPLGEYEVSESSDAPDFGLLLWGTRRNAKGEWRETRIPRSLCYPSATAKQTPRLSYRLYSEGGAVRWVRLVRLVEETR